MTVTHSTAPGIELDQLRFGWSPGAEPLLQIPHLHIARGERVFLYGPSGSGKTSLLNLLAGVHTPQSGQVRLLGEAFSRLSSRRRDRFRARHIGVIFQQFNLIPYLSVLDNVYLTAHFARLSTRSSGDIDSRARALLQALGLAPELATRPASQLSVGQQQRVAVARALIAEPEILLADEPTSALDSDSRDSFMQLLLETARDKGCTVVFVSHDRSLQQHFSRALDIRDVIAQEVA